MALGTHRRHPANLRVDALLWLAALVLISCAVLKLRPMPAAAVSPLDRSIAEINLDRVPLEEALRRLAEGATVKLVIDYQALAAASVDLKQPVDLHLHHVRFNVALEHLRSGAAGYAIDAKTVRITSADAIPYVTRIYDVQDIVDQMDAWRRKCAAQKVSRQLAALHRDLGSAETLARDQLAGLWLAGVADLNVPYTIPPANSSMWGSMRATDKQFRAWTSADRIVFYAQQPAQEEFEGILRRLRQQAVGDWRTTGP